MATGPITSCEIDGETMEIMTDFIFLGSKITADDDSSDEIKRRVLLGSKAMTNLDSISNSRDITLLTKVHIFKAMVFPVVVYGFESWTIKKAKHWRIYAFELWYWRRLLRIPWTDRRSNHSILKKSVLNIHGKEWCWSWNSNTLAIWWQRTNSLEKDPNAGKLEGRLRRGWEWMRLVGWHPWLTGHDFEQVPWVGEGQGGLACCNPWGFKESDTSEQLNWFSRSNIQLWLEENSVVEIFAWYSPSHLHRWCPFEVSDYWHWSCVDMYLWPSKQSEEADALFKVLPTGISLPLHFPSGSYLKILGVYFQLLPV